jgi:protein gp37
MGGGRYSRVEWGEPGKGVGTRDRTAPSNWSKVRKWNKQAADAPGRTFVFCASLADVFDNAVEPTWRRDLFDLIADTPNLTYLLLTKRPQNIVRLFGQAMGLAGGDKSACRAAWPRNAAIGATIEDPKRLLSNAETLRLAGATLKAAFTFWSCEPLIEDLGELPALPDWVITGGETDQGAHKARPAHPGWFRSLRDQCAAAGVPFHFKQWGEWQPMFHTPGETLLARRGKHADPCTLDGVKHDARPIGYA